MSCSGSLLLRVSFDMRLTFNGGMNWDSLASGVPVAAENLASFQTNKEKKKETLITSDRARKREKKQTSETKLLSTQMLSPSACDYSGFLSVHQGLFNLLPFIVTAQCISVAGVK